MSTPYEAYPHEFISGEQLSRCDRCDLRETAFVHQSTAILHARVLARIAELASAATSGSYSDSGDDWIANRLAASWRERAERHKPVTGWSGLVCGYCMETSPDYELDGSSPVNSDAPCVELCALCREIEVGP
jgi:hypothetical protein